jgi:hypothetical protein
VLGGGWRGLRPELDRIVAMQTRRRGCSLHWGPWATEGLRASPVPALLRQRYFEVARVQVCKAQRATGAGLVHL